MVAGDLGVPLLLGRVGKTALQYSPSVTRGSAPLSPRSAAIAAAAALASPSVPSTVLLTTRGLPSGVLPRCTLTSHMPGLYSRTLPTLLLAMATPSIRRARCS